MLRATIAGVVQQTLDSVVEKIPTMLAFVSIVPRNVWKHRSPTLYVCSLAQSPVVGAKPFGLQVVHTDHDCACSLSEPQVFARTKFG